MTETTIKPFAGALDLLEAEFSYLTARSRRLALEIEAREEVGTSRSRRASRHPMRADEETWVCRIQAAKTAEEEVRKAVDARRAVGPHVGIDALCHDFDLGAARDGDARLVLLTLAVPAVGGQSLAEATLDTSMGYMGGPDVGDLLVHLAPQTLLGHMRIRQLFEDSALVNEGLVELDQFDSDSGPDALWGCTARLSAAAFGVLVGG